MITLIIITSKLASFYSKKIPSCIDYVMCCITRTAIRFGLKSLTEFMLKNSSKEVTMANPELINLAAGCNDKDIVQMLLQKGFDINTQDEKQFSPIYMATIRGHIDMVKFLIHGADVNKKTNYGFTSIHAAVWFDKHEVTKVLQRNGARVDQPLDDGATALHAACEKGKTEIAKNLIKIGANIEAKDPIYHNWTPLHWAAAKNKPETVHMLLENKANIEAPSVTGITPLHLSIIKGHWLIFGILLQYGANIDALDHWNDSSLHLAIQNDHHQIAQVLLKLGLSLDTRNVDGNNAFEYCLTKNDKGFDIFKIITLHQITTN